MPSLYGRYSGTLLLFAGRHNSIFNVGAPSRLMKGWGEGAKYSVG